MSYCLKCRKYTESKNPSVVKIKKGRIMFLPNCAVCGSKKSIFIMDQEASGILGNKVGTKITALCDKPIANILF